MSGTFVALATAVVTSLGAGGRDAARVAAAVEALRALEGTLEGSTAAPAHRHLARMRAIGIEGLRPALDARLQSPHATPPTSARAVLRALGELGDGADLERAARALEDVDPSARRDLTLEFGDAVGAILARDPAASACAVRLAEQAGGASGAELARALSRAGARVELASLLGGTTGLDLSVLSALAAGLRREGATELTPAEAREVARCVRPYLRSTEQQLAREACALASLLEDGPATADLVALLTADHAPLVASAAAALEELTGLAWGADASRWSAWLDGELAWMETAAPTHFDDLGPVPEARALAALAELGRHRYCRERLAREVLRALDHDSPTVRASACATLERLAWRGVAADLVPLLSDSRPNVQEAAGRALRALTGERYGNREVAAWEEHFSR